MKGHFTPHTEETKRKISEAKRGQPSPRKGCKLSQETIEKIKATKKLNTKPHWNKGGSAPWAKGNKFGQGTTPWNRGKKYTLGPRAHNWKGGISKNSRCECGESKSYGSLRCPECFHEKNRGENHPNWKGGITPLYRQLRVQRIAKNGGSHTTEEWRALKEKFGFICLCCKQTEPKIKLVRDHVVPVSLGGTDDISNIQPLCEMCNSIKWAKAIDYRLKSTHAEL